MMQRMKNRHRQLHCVACCTDDLEQSKAGHTQYGTHKKIPFNTKPRSKTRAGTDVSFI